jgi:opacity-associated protein A-like protein
MIRRLRDRHRRLILIVALVTAVAFLWSRLGRFR